MTENHLTADNDTERRLLTELRRAKLRSKKQPETFIIRVVDGIVQMMIAEPFPLRDDRHLDNRKRRG